MVEKYFLNLLIYEDKGYLDGTIPEEENTYIFDIEKIGIKDT